MHRPLTWLALLTVLVLLLTGCGGGDSAPSGEAYFQTLARLDEQAEPTAALLFEGSEVAFIEAFQGLFRGARAGAAASPRARAHDESSRPKAAAPTMPRDPN